MPALQSRAVSLKAAPCLLEQADARPGTVKPSELNRSQTEVISCLASLDIYFNMLLWQLHWALAVILIVVLLVGLFRSYRILKQATTQTCFALNSEKLLREMCLRPCQTQHPTVVRHAPEAECRMCSVALECMSWCGSSGNENR